MKRSLPIAVMILSAAVFALATVLMLQGQPFFSRWYYCFAWWPYILFVQSLLRLRNGAALLYRDPARFLTLLPLSIIIWLVFEVFNFRLNNWHYIGLPASTLERWTGYILSYATVVPGIFTTAALLEHLGIFSNLEKVRALKAPRRLFLPCVILGSFCYVLPLAWPRFFFPLVWGSFVLLLEPINYQMGAPSLLRAWSRGSVRTAALLLASGAICGLLWELWNFWAESKWVYTVPFVGRIKLFEMPVLGFLGFPPFALECYAMVYFLKGLGRTARTTLSPAARAVWFGLAVAAGTAFTLITLHGIDLYTVLSLTP